LEKYIVNCKDITPGAVEGLFGGEGKFLRFPMYCDAAAPPFTVIAETEMAPGARAGLHVQPDQQELLYLLAGDGHFTMDGETTAVHPGDAILARAGTNFGLANTGSTPLRYLVVKCRR
jgi:oxalate decarboxylase/phosphoglucose isomerase-like protein (cupin superfamily)